MTDFNAGYIVTLETSQRDELDEVLHIISRLNGVISVKPIVEDIQMHIASERIAHEISGKFAETFLSIAAFLQDKIQQGEKHRKFDVECFKKNKELSSQIFSDRFKQLLDQYVYCGEDKLDDRQKELRRKLMEFCGENLVCYHGPYHIPKWKDITE